MKVLMINGSPHKNGCTYTALKEMAKVFNEQNVETEIVFIGNNAYMGCDGCKWCRKAENAKCKYDDIVRVLQTKLNEADGLVIGSPVHHGGASGPLVTVLNRLFYSSKFIDLRFKVGTVIVSARRSGLTTTFSQLNKFLTYNNMVVATSQYWNNVHGDTPEEVSQDLEGLQTMRTLAKNMIFLMQAIKDGKNNLEIPELEKRITTNFIR